MPKGIFPIASPDLSGNELEYVTQSLKEGWVSCRGPWVEEFEEKFAIRHGARYGVSCTSGTTALMLALAALNIGKGDEVIVPEFTMIATAWAVSYVGATPIFVDCDDNILIDVDKIEEKITARTKAIIPVHIYGRRVSIERIRKIADEYNLKIIVDAAEVHGMEACGDISCYSFFANKILTTGEGGMCVTDDKELAERLFYLKNMSFSPDHTFVHNEIGYNFRMTSLQAALGLAQLERLGEFLAKRKQIEEWYNEGLRDIPQITIQPSRKLLWMYDILAEQKEDLMEHLKENGIETRHFFKPMSMQPMYLDGNYKKLKAYWFSQRGLYLPTYTQLTKEDVVFICEKIKEFYGQE